MGDSASHAATVQVPVIPQAQAETSLCELVTTPVEVASPAADLSVSKQHKFPDLYMQATHLRSSADIDHEWYTGLQGKELV